VGLLDRISARTVDRPTEQRYAMDQWLSDYLIPAVNQFSYQGHTYPTGLNQTWPGTRSREIANTLPGYLAALRSCPPAFAAQMVRALVLSQARFTFRTRPGYPKAGQTFGTRELDVLERPWTNATTGELIARMEWHAGLAGNAYVLRQPDRLRVLRPDWVIIVYGSQQQPEDAAHALDGDLIGYAYCNGGFNQAMYPVQTLLPQDVAHWSPLPDPENAGVGMSWLTPALREIQVDRAASQHKLMFFENGAPQPYDAGVLTPGGWVEMGSIRVGDRVFGSDGKPKTVLGVYPQGIQDIYRVTFSSGGSTECTADHLWTVASAYDRKRGVTRTLPLSRLVADGISYDSGPFKWSVPLVEPVEFDDPGDLPIDPYLLGSLLGDGSFRSNGKGSGGVSMAAHRDDVDEQQAILTPLLPEDVTIVRRDRSGWSEFYFKGPGGPRTNPLTARVRGLGLFDKPSYEKMIPEAYLRASVNQRVALLQGLIDTDGSVLRKQPNTVRFDSTSERLAEQVGELASSLGAIASVRAHRLATGKARAQWRASISRLPEWIVPCRLARKAAMYRPDVRGGRWRYIQSVEHVGRKPAQCIGVDSDDHLYVTDDFILTHNTPNLVVKGIPATTSAQFQQLVDLMEEKHAGVANAYRTLYLTAGADATVVGSDLQQLDLKNTQGGGETRIAMLSRVHPVILGASEGLGGSSLNAGNFGMARRIWADSWIYPTLQDLAASVAPLVRVPADAELWTKTGDMPILREDAKDAAEIEQIKASTMSSLITQGFTRKSVIAAVTAQDMTLLEEDPQWISVQLQQATGQQTPALPVGGVGPKVPPAARSDAGDVDDLDDETWALLVALDELSSEVRAWDPAKHARIPKGQPGAGQFLGMVEHIKGAIAEHLASGGKGDPFEHFSREQLRRAAKARGHTLPKGISREDIAKLLLDDLAKTHVGPKKTAKPKIAAGPRDAIDHVPDGVKKLVFSSYKAQPHGQLLTSSTDLSYENLLALAHVYGKKVDGGLSVLQAARIVDEQLTKNQGLPNKGFLEKKLKDWLATPEGAGYVKYNTEPTQSIVDSITGEVAHSPGVKLKPGQKVPKLSGPGAYRKTLLPGAFAKHTDVQMNALQDAYLKEHGITWTPDQVAAITNYSGGGYTGMNGYLRGKSDASPLVKKQVADLQAAMVPVQEHALVLRGTGWDQFPEGFRQADAVEKLVGKTIVDQGFVSTSVAGVGGHFSHQPVKLEIEVPKGTPAVFLKKYSYHDSENELLLAAGTKFRVVSVSHANGKTHVRLRVVTPK
jgi:phage portal protein BeeE